MEKMIEIIQTRDNSSVEELIIKEAIKNLGDPFRNITVKEVAKDLKMGENLTNKLFKRKDFPSVNIGKEKTVTLLAYILWKMKKQENDELGNKNNE